MKLNLRAIDLNLLPVFVAILEEGRMSKAAARLGMTQPAASQALARLRRTLDDELFARTRRGMIPTPRALALAEPIREALERIRETLSTDRAFDPARAERRFTIKFGLFTEMTILPALVERAARAGEGIRVRSGGGMADLGVDLVRERVVDLCFDTVIPEDGRLRSQMLGREQAVVIARRDHPRLRRGCTAEDYFRERHVILALDERRRVLFEQLIGREGAGRKILAEVSECAAVPMLVARSDAVATVSAGVAEVFRRAFELRVFPFPLPIPRLPLYLVWHEGMTGDPGHAWLRRTIAELVSSSAHGGPEALKARRALPRPSPR